MRKWDADGFADEDEEGRVLDYSAPSEPNDSATVEEVSGQQTIDRVANDSWGRRTRNGEFVLKDLDEEMDSILSSANANKASDEGSASVVSSSLGAIGGLFRNVIGGKTITQDDLVKPMKGMEDHLLKKNVAREAAVRLCESVERSLVGTKTGNFTSESFRLCKILHVLTSEGVQNSLRSAMESALRKILTPTTSLDLLREIQTVTSPSALSLVKPRPYVISIVGVNGVGKSTNLSKICFFLLQNKYKVLVVAADTFRSGAVEQLRVHVRNLRELSAREGGSVDLYERGYGKDASLIAKEAVTYAAAENFDVVLIDTAGRRHNDQRLMSSLEKFAKMAQPDKISYGGRGTGRYRLCAAGPEL